MNSKNHPEGEINNSPVPSDILEMVFRSGLQVCCYYEKIMSTQREEVIFRRFPYYCLTHLLDGDGFYLDSKDSAPVVLKPGDGTFLPPGKLHSYGGYRKHFTEDSICFLGPAADALHQAGIITAGTLRIGSERRLLPIIQKLREATVASMFEANFMLLQLLIELHRTNNLSGTSKPHRQLKNLLKELHSDLSKWWTVGEMAEYCNISDNYLRRLFRTETGMSPKKYIDQIKMNKAVEILCTSSIKVTKVADKLGYVDPYHFIRRFTATTGISPSRYRKLYSHNPQ